MCIGKKRLSRICVIRLIGPFVALACLAVIASRARADSITETGTFALTPTAYGFSGFDPTTSNGSDFIAVAQYDPSQHLFAPITSITVSWQASVTQTYSVTDPAAASNTTYTFTGTDNVYIFEPPSSDPNTDILALSQGITTASGSINSGQTIDGSNDPTATTDTVTIPGTDEGGTNLTSAEFVYYTGSGNVDFDITANATEQTTSNNGSATGSIATDAGGTVSVTYFFTPVPEPGTWAFMCTGVTVGWYALKRRRHTTAAAKNKRSHK